MAHPVIWSPKTFFYPIGNTPATSLTEYLPPDIDAALLVLGCGDPRNTLYTIHSESKLPFKRTLDFTFCDAEPAVLARNIFMYTLLYDQSDGDTIQSLWKIYFDVFIDKKAFDLVVSHCTELIAASTTLETWNSHSYGFFIKLCTRDTLAILRRYWELYSAKGQSPTKMKVQVLKDLRAIHADKTADGIVTTSLRTAGVMILEMGMHGPNHFKHYWTQGVTSVDPIDIEKATHVNTTLLYSSSGSRLNIHSERTPFSKTIERILKVVERQFNGWCRSFHDRMSSENANIRLRFFVGNALTFCMALKYVSQIGRLDTPEYTNAWGASTISFTHAYAPSSPSRAPTVFNVIETSNLADHLGLVNILLMSAPLLRRDVSSVLFTCALVGSKDNRRQHKSILEKTEAELPLLSLAVGLVPDRVASEYTSQSIVHEAIMSGMNSKCRQLLEFNAWRIAAPGSWVSTHGLSLSCDPSSLASALFAAYLKFFEDEGISSILSNPESITTLKHYTRETFVELLFLIRHTFEGDWEAVMDHFLRRVGMDRTLLIGLQNYQDMCRALWVKGLNDIILDPASITPRAHDSGVRGWVDVPRSVYVVLVVPRTKIQHLIDDSEGIKAPCLQCEITCPGGQMFFPSFHPSFGRFEGIFDSRTGATHGIIHEDPAGWAGSSDVICAFPCPAWMFVKWPLSAFSVGLMMFGRTAMLHYTQKLGLNLSIFSTTMADSKRTFLLRDRPRVAPTQTASQGGSLASASPLAPPTPLARTDGRQLVEVKFLGANVASLATLWAVDGAGPKAALTDKGTKVVTRAVSVSAVEVSFTSFKTVLHFPYPIDHSSLVTRIARKSSYVEIEGRITAYGAVRIPVDLKPFPIVLASNPSSSPWALGMHYVSLDALPAFRASLPFNDNSSWLHSHFGGALGEEKKQAGVDQNRARGLLDVKESLSEMFLQVLTTNRGKSAVVHLKDPANGGTFTLLFVSCIRLDLTAHTVVVDACALPLTIPLLSTREFDTALRNLMDDVHAGRLMSFNVQMGGEEVKWWNAFLPTVAERCRTWKHNPSCEYISEGVPRSLEMEKDPLCSCGRGKNLGGFDTMKGWERFAPYVTRVALGMPFSTSLLGGTASMLRASVREAKGMETGVGRDGDERCAECRGAGKPKLLVCSRCKGAKYCSAACQKANWKKHKVVCSK